MKRLSSVSGKWRLWTVVTALIGSSILLHQNCGGFHVRPLEDAASSAIGLNAVKDTAALILRDGDYDYSPSGFLDDDGTWKVYTCASDTKTSPGDQIFLATFDKRGRPLAPTRAVLLPSYRDNTEDGEHACAPTVVKHATPSLLGGREHYKLYYECSPRMYRCTNGTCSPHIAYTNICLAVSEDGVTWQRYDSRKDAFVPKNEPAWPLVYAASSTSPEIKQAIQYQFINGKHTHTANQIEYGVGHPSAVVVETEGRREVWVWYYDSRGNAGEPRLNLMKSRDGIHFDPPVATDQWRNADVKWVKPTANRPGYFIAGFGINGENYSGYSRDGVNWLHPGRPPSDELKIGRAKTGLCQAPAPPSFLSDASGALDEIENAHVLSGEGLMAPSEYAGNPKMPTYCVSEKENTARGSTWDLYLLVADLTPPDRFFASSPDLTPAPPPMTCNMTCSPAAYGGFKCIKADGTCPSGMELNQNGNNCRPTNANPWDQWVWGDDKGCSQPRNIACGMVCAPGNLGGWKCRLPDGSCPTGMTLNPQGTNCRPASATDSQQWIWENEFGCGDPRQLF